MTDSPKLKLMRSISIVSDDIDRTAQHIENDDERDKDWTQLHLAMSALSLAHGLIANTDSEALNG